MVYPNTLMSHFALLLWYIVLVLCPQMKTLGEMPHKILLVSIIHRALKEFRKSSRLQPGNKVQEAEICRAISMTLKWEMTVLLLP